MNPEASMQLLTSDTFNFACHQDISCFTACCAKLNLVLTPYDIIRLKKRLKLSSGAFLKTYATSFIDKSHGIPMVQLKMKNNGKQRCPFVTPEGCDVYADRPGACRVYPLGRAASKMRERKKSDECYFLIKERHCCGFFEKKEWRVKEWIKDQGLAEYNAVNEFYLDIITGKNFRRINSLNTQQIQMFYMSCYDIDEFKAFLFKSTFQNRFEVDRDQMNRINTDDIELMKFACRWLRFALFGEKTLLVKSFGTARHIQPAPDHQNL